jgi:hypothetical protein
MGAARRLSVKAVVLAGMICAVVSLALPACQFPEYHMASEHGGSAGASEGGSGNRGGVPDNGGEGGGDVGGASGAGGEGGEKPTPPTCAEERCIPKAPTGWLGPFAYWEGKAPALPNCPDGYDAPTDLHRGLIAPASACTCTCAAQDQVCETTLHIYDDMGCATKCATVSVQEEACSAVSTCDGSQGSVKNDTPTVSGGSCIPTVSEPVDARWQYNARLCEPQGVCEGPNQVCAPTPDSPYLTQLCVMVVIPEGEALPPCPPEYPKVDRTYYEDFTDDRGCSECGCSGVTGGSCSGKVLISSGGGCSVGVSYELGGGCKAFNLGSGDIQPSFVGGDYMVVAGTCGVASPAQATGSAQESGNGTKVCCQ